VGALYYRVLQKPLNGDMGVVHYDLLV